MAKLEVEGLQEFEHALDQLGAKKEAVLKAALYEGVKVVKDEIIKRLDALPEDNPRFLRGDDQYDVVTAEDKQDLRRSIGVAKIQMQGGSAVTSISFDGYGTRKTSKYPQGRPMLMLARSIESGSSVRKKVPFVRQAVNASKQRAIVAMADKTREMINNIMEGK